MDVAITKAFFKKNYKGMLLWLGMFTACYMFDGHRIYTGLIIAFAIIHFQNYRAFVNEAKWIKATGQTAEQLADTIFLNKWRETRARGLWRYSLIEGGLVNGAFFGILIGSFSSISGISNRFPVSDNSFALIVFMYGIGIVIGFVLHRSYWIGNERRFERLTQSSISN